MNCRLFRRELPDWLRGMLNESESAAMETHRAECRFCAKEEALERHLRGAWKSMPESPREPEVWPRVAAALDRPRATGRLRWRPAGLALGSAFAVMGLIALLISQNGSISGPPPNERPTTVISAAEERRVVQMVEELRRIPDLESDRMALEPPHLRNAAVFLGASEGELSRQ
jgi:anti-sigma factor RsiW